MGHAARKFAYSRRRPQDTVCYRVVQDWWETFKRDREQECREIPEYNVALQLAVKKLLGEKKLKTNPIQHAVAAISCGIVEGEILVDLDYSEDSNADADMNVVLLDDGRLLEVQGTAEKRPFELEELNTIIRMSQESLAPVFKLQQYAIEGNPVEL